MKRILGVVVTGLVISSLPQSAVASVHAVAKVTCKVTKSIAHTPKEVATPKKVLPGKIGSLTLVTNCGNIVIKTDGVKAPVTLTALTTLAKGGFYDHSLCHRVTTTQMWVLQCGDPTAKGNGGPAFSFQDENLPMTQVNNYPSGTVAMANSGSPGTNGSQFFLVYGDTTLPANYTVWGTITSGLNILKAIGAAGIKGGGTDGTPVKTIAIEKVIVK